MYISKLYSVWGIHFINGGAEYLQSNEYISITFPSNKNIRKIDTAEENPSNFATKNGDYWYKNKNKIIIKNRNTHYSKINTLVVPLRI